MNAEVEGPVEVTSSRRRGSTVRSTGLDYSTGLRVDEDIICRIRSLLLSRNDHCPPRTPYPSDEDHCCSEIDATIGGFDFSTAKSVAKIARQETGRLSTPDMRRLSSKSTEMESRKTPRYSLPSIKFGSSRVRSSSSCSELKVHADDAVQSLTLPSIDPDLPGEAKPRFKLPKLILQDKKKASRKVKSCMEISPSIPEDDARIHETELLCCPPCEANNVSKSQCTTNYPRWPGGTVRAVPGDLACFLAGCPPSHLECKKHHRRHDPQYSSVRDRRIVGDFKGVGEGLVHDITRLGHSLKDVKIWSKDRPDEQQDPKLDGEHRPSQFGNDGGKGMPSISIKPPTSSSGKATQSETCSSVTSTSDAFPHAYQSMELIATEAIPYRLSTTVTTNFSLPGYKAGPSSASGPRHSKQKSGTEVPQVDTMSSPRTTVTFTPEVITSERTPSDVSPKTTPLCKKEIESTYSKPPSLASSGSRRSASARHALLKPFVTEAQPVDPGLPIPPVLSPIATISEQTKAEASEKMKVVAVTDFAEVEKAVLVTTEAAQPASQYVGHLTRVQNAEDLLQSVRNRIEGARAEPPQPLPERPLSPPPVIIKAKAPAGAPQIIAESAASPPPGKTSVEATESLAAVSQADTVNAAYWGFVPAIKDAVQDAVQIAVRNAVQEVGVSAGLQKQQATDAYRRVVASSLVEAARTADDYLRRASLWNEPTSSLQGSESTVLCGTDRQINDFSPSADDPPSEQIRPASVMSKENVETGGKRQVNLVLSVDDMDYVPLEKEEPPKCGKKRRKNRARFGYDAIPTRNSSKNQVLNTKTSATKVASNIPRKRSYERLVTRVQLRSVSSETSLLQEKVGEELFTSSKKLDRRDDHSSLSLEPMVGGQNTVHWLKGLLSGNGTYETRFTALPPRTRRASKSQSPAKPASRLYLEASDNADRAFVRNQLSDLQQDEKTAPSQSFTRTINDLENLMNEALVIARQAADNQDATYAPAVLSNAARILKSGRDRYEAKLSGMRDSQGSNDPRIHESLRSYSESEGTCQSEDSELYVQPSNAPGKGLTISLRPTPGERSAGWPPTGRVKTPYPPKSTVPSKEPLVSPPEPDDYLTAADPRSLHTEMQLEAPPKQSEQAEPNAVPDGDEDFYEGPKPEFRTLEPFSVPVSRDRTRKSSAKSPKRLSPTRQTESGAQPDLEDLPVPKLTSRKTSPARMCEKGGHSEEDHEAVKNQLLFKAVPNEQEVRDYIVANRNVPITPRTSSRNLRKQAELAQGRGRSLLPTKTGLTTKTGITGKTYDWQNVDMESMPLVKDDNKLAEQQAERPAVIDQPDCARSFDGSLGTEEVDFEVGFGVRQRGGGEPSRGGWGVELKDDPDPNLPQLSRSGRRQVLSLSGKNHLSLKEHHLKGFSLTKSHKRQSIARDWSPGRKRFVASVACLSTALIGIEVGIYAGETPAIQYYIVDFHHYTVLGNVFFFIGLAIPTFFFWPLPLLHGRKPYILGSMSLAMPLLFPQALAVGTFRSPYVSTYRVGLIMSRALMGFCLGFANMNFKSMLTDLFGASLQSENPHQEHVDEFDVRRHGGGMGVWLGLWTWSALGSIGLGFLIGAAIVNHLPPAWGFYVSIIIIAFIMLLNVLCPEVRRSTFRRSVAEVVHGQEVSRRLARGEVKMHLVQTGPKWWGEEFHYGVMLSLKMIRQPGFMVMALYVAWIYGQMVLNILLLAALMSKNYKFTSPRVGASVMAIPIGAFCAIPFQKASLFSRSRESGPPNDDQTFQKKVSWTSHMVRRAIFILVLPFSGLGYTLTASGPPIPFIVPILFAGLIGFLSNLAMAECHGIIMETFDTSDLQPGMTGRPRGSSGDKTASKRTNYSSFPRVCSAFAITQGMGYLIAAAASGVGGVLSRHLGQQAAFGVMSGILLILSVMLLGVLVRFTEVQIIPDSKKAEMDRYHNARRASQFRREEGMEEDEPWRPVIIGNPHHHTRRMCLLELGSLSRFSEIRRKNKLVDEKSLEAKHPNRAAIEALENKIKEKEKEVVNHVRNSLSRASSRGSRRSKLADVPEQGDLGGHREMGTSRGNSGKGLGRGAGSKGRNLSRVQDVG